MTIISIILFIGIYISLTRALFCGANMDPPGTFREGSDILSFPLPTSATVDDCIALCCQTSTCRAISYNNPQPQYTSVGGNTCPTGSNCCMLKGAVPSLNTSNPWPSVRTGVLNLTYGPGPDPPFPVSTFINSVAFIDEPW
jgi:PAN domain